MADQTNQSLRQRSYITAIHARLVGAGGPCAEAWLDATRVPSMGNRLDDEAVRIAVSLRLVAPVCVPHTCRSSAAVTKDGLHGLDCSSKRRQPRHEELNNIIHRALSPITGHSFLNLVK